MCKADTFTLRPNRPGEDINYYYALPVWKRRTQEDITSINVYCEQHTFDCDFVCSFVPFIHDDGRLAWVGVTQRLDPNNPCLGIHMDRDTKQLTIQFSQEHNDLIMDKIERETKTTRFLRHSGKNWS